MVKIAPIIWLFQLIDEKCPNCRIRLSLNEDILSISEIDEIKLLLVFNENRRLSKLENNTLIANIELFDDSPLDFPFKELDIEFDSNGKILVKKYQQTILRSRLVSLVYELKGDYETIRYTLLEMDFGQ